MGTASEGFIPKCNTAGVMSHSGEEVGHSRALLGDCNICRIAKLGPKISSAPEEYKKPFAVHHLESSIVIAKRSWQSKQSKGSGALIYQTYWYRSDIDRQRATFRFRSINPSHNTVQSQHFTPKSIHPDIRNPSWFACSLSNVTTECWSHPAKSISWTKSQWKLPRYK